MQIVWALMANLNLRVVLHDLLGHPAAASCYENSSVSSR